MDLLRSSRRYLSCLCGAPLLASVLATAFVLETRVATAEESPDEQAPAHQQYRRAFELMNDKRWLEARRLLLDLWLKSKTYDVAASLGQVEYQLRNYSAGARYLAFALANVPPMEKPETVQRFKNAFAEIKKHVAVATITVRPVTAEVLVDGAAADNATLDAVYLDPGLHKFEARTDAGNATERTLELAAGETYIVDLHVNTTPANGVAGAQSDAANASSGTGKPGTSDGAQEYSLVPIYVGAGVTAIGVGLTVAFGVAAKSAKKEAGELRERVGAHGCRDGSALAADCSAASDAYDRQRRDATISKVGIGVTVAGGLATAGYLIFSLAASSRATPSSAKPTGLRPRVEFDGHNLGFAVTGAF
jgi:hypothetical protein